MTAIFFIRILLYLLGFLFLFFAVRYLWISIHQRIYHPEMWLYHLRNNNIPRAVIRFEKTTDDKIRLYNFWYQINRIFSEEIPGDFAELGVYKGDSAWVIHQLAPERKFHLFDTFQGFYPPDLVPEKGEAASYGYQDFADTDPNLVKDKLGDSPNILFHVGHFPQTTIGLENTYFSFVHIDADLFFPVSTGLDFFYPRLSPGGVIMVHDYNPKWEGLMRAVDQFVRTIPENLIHVPDRYGTVMIIKNKCVG